MNEVKVVPPQPNPKAEPAGGDGVDARLRAVEERLVRLETRMDYMATKEDLKDLKIWVLGSALSTGIPIVLLMIKVFFL